MLTYVCVILIDFQAHRDAFIQKVAYISQFAPASIMNSPLLHERVWFEKNKYDEAARLYYENLVKVRHNMASQKVHL